MKRLVRRDGGFILIMTLVLLSIAAVLSASIAQQSLALASRTHSEIVDMQRRWAVASCRRVLFDVSSQLLTQAVRDDNGATRQLAFPFAELRVTLSGVTYDMTLTDEQAKADVNTLAMNLPVEQLQDAIRELVGRSAGVRVRLRPIPLEATPERRLFQSWGQVFQPDDRLRQAEYAKALHAATRDITCWASEGRLNPWTASDRALERICSLAVSPIETAELLAARKSWEHGDVEEFVGSLKLTERKRELLTRLLTDDRGAVSLWVHARSEIVTRHYLFVESRIQGGIVRQYAFAW